MTNKLKWRLSKLPTSEEVSKLVNDKIITKEEAREILFTEETQEKIEEDNLKSEIKFLREIIEKLSNRSQIIETIKTIQIPYIQTPWYGNYQVWCTSNGVQNYSNTSLTALGSTNTMYASGTTEDFSEIKTF